jgi:hypothetical protein
VTVSASQPFDSHFGISVTDPTVVGYTPATLSGTSASLSVFAIAPGSTSISFSDEGGSVAVTTSSDLPCGRPSNLFYNSTLIVPAPGATAVPTNVGALYFAVYSYGLGGPPTPNLHVIIGAHQSFEAGALVVDAPPFGVPTPAPISGETLTYMRATVPQLTANTSYRTQLYEDTCQSALLAGAFST